MAGLTRLNRHMYIKIAFSQESKKKSVEIDTGLVSH
jgi:hypothetical protein